MLQSARGLAVVLRLRLVVRRSWPLAGLSTNVGLSCLYVQASRFLLCHTESDKMILQASSLMRQLLQHGSDADDDTA